MSESGRAAPRAVEPNNDSREIPAAFSLGSYVRSAAMTASRFMTSVYTTLWIDPNTILTKLWEDLVLSWGRNRSTTGHDAWRRALSLPICWAMSSMAGRTISCDFCETPARQQPCRRAPPCRRH